MGWTAEDLKKLNLVERDGKYVPVSSLTAKNVKKLPNLLEREVEANYKPVNEIDFHKPEEKWYPNSELRNDAILKNTHLYTDKEMPTPVHKKDWGKYETPVKNRKIRNATKSVNEQGVKFDSTLERYMYDLLTASKIDFEFQRKYTLQPGFKYREESVRPISLTVDFYLPTRHIICDTKGLQTQQGAMRWKMLKSYLKHIEDDTPEIIILKNRKECELLLNRLIYQK